MCTVASQLMAAGLAVGCFHYGLYFPTQYTDMEAAKRLRGYLSSTRTETYDAILVILHSVAASRKDVYLFVDSQGALLEPVSPSPTDYDPVSKCLTIVRALEAASATVHFTWLPSHIGIQPNEKVDCLAGRNSSV